MDPVVLVGAESTGHKGRLPLKFRSVESENPLPEEQWHGCGRRAPRQAARGARAAGEAAGLAMAELGFAPKGPTPIHCDNTSTIAVAKTPMAEKHLKHVARRHFFVQDAVKAGEIVVSPIASCKNIADIFTKILPSPAQFEELTARLRSWIAPL